MVCGRMSLVSMITEYTRLSTADLAELRRVLADSPFEAFEFVSELGDQGEYGGAPRGMDTDKAWAAIEYLLAFLDPPVDVISGGDPITDAEWGYDSPRLFSSGEVTRAAQFLDATAFTRLVERYNAKALADAQVYPQIWDEADALDYIGSYYEDLVRFFRAAAANGESILVRLS